MKHNREGNRNQSSDNENKEVYSKGGHYFIWYIKNALRSLFEKISMSDEIMKESKTVFIDSIGKSSFIVGSYYCSMSQLDALTRRPNAPWAPPLASSRASYEKSPKEK